MGAIEVKPERIFTYTGHIRSIKSKSWSPEIMEIVCRGPEYGDAPAMFEVKDEIKQYLEDLHGTQFAETYMCMTFHFNEWCELLAIDLLDDNGKVVKQVKPGVEWRPFIGEVGAVIGPWAGQTEEKTEAGE